MTGHRLLPGPDARLRITPWRGDPATAHLTPTRGRPTAQAVARALEELALADYTRALTPALPRADQHPFLEAGFEVHERLHLLRRRLHDLPEGRATPALRRGRPTDRAAVLTVDASAFPAFWQLDGPGLDDAVAATPSTRLRVATDGSVVVGYAVTGRAGPRGYLQRLAVAPGHQRGGTGTALVLDGLRWLRRWGAREVLVNTQEGNEPAVQLYQALGFHLQPEGLAVLERTIAGGG